MNQTHTDIARTTVKSIRERQSFESLPFSRQFCLVFLIILSLAAPPSTLRAEVTYTGNVEPDPSTWDRTIRGYVGRTENGTLLVNSPSVITSSFGYIGGNSGIQGTATIDGSGSVWSTMNHLAIGYYGSGTLNIMRGGFVTGPYSYIGEELGSEGLVIVDGAESVWESRYDLHVGSEGIGNLRITHGATVYSSKGNDSNSTLGRYGSSTGTVSVDGDGSTWDSGDLHVGESGDGELNITNGGHVSSGPESILGFWSLSTGIATITGANSTWSTSDALQVGLYGAGTLNINSGGTVDVGGTTFLARSPASTGTIDFGSGGGTLLTRSLAASPDQLLGTGTVETRGLISDFDLVFDSDANLKQSFLLNGQSDQNVAINLDLSTNPSANGDLGVGWRGKASMTIQNGVTINSESGYVGHRPGSTGRATIAGAGSTWNCDILYVGYFGRGILRVADGGTINSDYAYVGFDGRWNTVTVIGRDSTWTNNSRLSIGYDSNGYGTLNIINGGKVETEHLSIYSHGMVTIDVGNGSELIVDDGNGSLTGKVCVIAGAKLEAGDTFTPIRALGGVWSVGCKAVGGTWDPTSREFTVSEIQKADTTGHVRIDLAESQRVLIEHIGEDNTSRDLGASFLASSTSKILELTATVITDSAPSGLESDEIMLGAWDFVFASGYSSGSPACLSFQVGPGLSSDRFHVWHRSGDEWTAFEAMDLYYDGDYVNFTVTGFCGYAVTGTMVPEPNALAMLLIIGFAALPRFLRCPRPKRG